MIETLSIRLAVYDDIPLIVSLANAVWPITYKDILTSSQIKYMMEMMYSPDSLRNQIKEPGQQFIIISDSKREVGFASYAPTKAQEIFKLHKIYVLPDQQGKGLGKMIIDWIVHQIGEKGAHSLRLNVNRFNRAKQFYERLDFKIIGEEDVDIGNGYFMNDFIMEKRF